MYSLCPSCRNKAREGIHTLWKQMWHSLSSPDFYLLLPLSRTMLIFQQLGNYSFSSDWSQQLTLSLISIVSYFLQKPVLNGTYSKALRSDPCFCLKVLSSERRKMLDTWSTLYTSISKLGDTVFRCLIFCKEDMLSGLPKTEMWGKVFIPASLFSLLTQRFSQLHILLSWLIQ